MFRMLLFIALALPFFAFAQEEPIPGTILYMDETVSHMDETVSRESLLTKLTYKTRNLKLNPLFQKNEKELARLNVLLDLAYYDNIPTKIDVLEKEIADLEVVQSLQKMPLEDIRYKLARLNDRGFFKLKDIPSLLKENNRLSISLDNAIKSLKYRLGRFPFDTSEELSQEKTDKEILMMRSKLHDYIYLLEEWQDNINDQKAHLLSDQNRYHHALEITVIKKAIQAISAPLKFLNNILLSRKNTLFAELKNELTALNINIEKEDFDIIGGARNALNNPLYDRKNKNAIRNLLEQEGQLQNSPIHALFWEANWKIFQLSNKLLEIEPDSAFEIHPYVLKMLYIPPSIIFPVTTPGV